MSACRRSARAALAAWAAPYAHHTGTTAALVAAITAEQTFVLSSGARLRAGAGADAILDELVEQARHIDALFPLLPPPPPVPSRKRGMANQGGHAKRPAAPPPAAVEYNAVAAQHPVVVEYNAVAVQHPVVVEPAGPRVHVTLYRAPEYCHVRLFRPVLVRDRPVVNVTLWPAAVHWVPTTRSDAGPRGRLHGKEYIAPPGIGGQCVTLRCPHEPRPHEPCVGHWEPEQGDLLWTPGGRTGFDRAHMYVACCDKGDLFPTAMPVLTHRVCGPDVNVVTVPGAGVPMRYSAERGWSVGAAPAQWLVWGRDARAPVWLLDQLLA